MAIICSTDYRSYPMGGMMSFILDILPSFSNEFDITLWGVLVDGTVPESLEIGGVSYSLKIFSNVNTGNKIIPNLVKVSINIWKMREEIMSYDYDIIYVHGIPLSFPFFNKKNVKIVNHIHGLTNPFSMTENRMARNAIAVYLYEKYRSWVVSKSDMILLASDKQGYTAFSSRYPNDNNKIIYVPNFADENIFTSVDQICARKKLGLEADEIIFVNTGRVSLQKDPVLLVQSFISFMKTFDYKARLIIIGDGELRETIEELAKVSGFQNEIQITGKLDRREINLWLNAADLYVYTSHANGFPISLAESASCGLPIVTTDVTGVHDLVINDRTGYLVQTRKSEDIANAIAAALAKRQEFSGNMLDITKNYRPDIIIDRMKQLLLAL